MLRKLILFPCIILALALAGCAPAPALSSPSPAQQAQTSPDTTMQPLPGEPSTAVSPPVQSETGPTQTPAKTTPAEHFTYAIGGTKIIRTNTGTGEKSQVYDAKKHYAANTELVNIRKLYEGGDALYFLEYGGLKDPIDSDIPSTDSIVRIGKDGSGRKVLASVNGITGYTEFALFQDRIFYVEDGFDSVAPGDMRTDGSGKDELWDAYAKAHNVSTDCLSATLRIEGDRLIIEADFYSLDFEKDETHVISVDAELNMTTVSIQK